MTEFQPRWLDLVELVWTDGQEVEVGQWQSQDIRDKPHMISRELTHVSFTYAIPEGEISLALDLSPTLSIPWAEDHFQERVSGQPLNPPPSEQWWPYAVKGNEAHKAGEQFSHTYPERIWPKRAGTGFGPWNAGSSGVIDNRGIRYRYGDLQDVVELLVCYPLTRQAYLPIWFPEDTGAAAGQRVPCTLGYHFLMRRDKLDIVYHIRSCDLLRHFTDDVYLAARLAQWMVGKLRERGIPDVRPGTLVMHISSLHYFRGDYPRIQLMLADREDETTYGSPV